MNKVCFLVFLLFKKDQDLEKNSKRKQKKKLSLVLDSQFLYQSKFFQEEEEEDSEDEENDELCFKQSPPS